MSSFFLLPRPFSFFFNDPPSPEIYTLSLHDALPISLHRAGAFRAQGAVRMFRVVRRVVPVVPGTLKAVRRGRARCVLKPEIPVLPLGGLPVEVVGKVVIGPADTISHPPVP